MKNINSVLINNSLKAGHSEEIFKTLELLNKIGVIPTKKPRAKTKKSKMSEDEIKQTGDMGPGFAETKDDGGAGAGGPQGPSSRFPSRSVPLLGYQAGTGDSIQNLNKAIEDKKTELKQLENRSFNNPQIEDIKRSYNEQLGLLTDKLEQVQSMGQYMGGALYSLGSRFGQIENKIRQEPESVPVGISEPIDPFKDVKGSNDAVEADINDIDMENDMEDEDIDMTNQGSQDIPHNIMSVDVAPQADEILEDDEEQMPALEETGEVEDEETVPAKAESAQVPAPVVDKFQEVEKFYGFKLPRGKNQSVDAIKNYVKTLANESQTTINYDKLKNRAQWEDKLNQLVNKQYDSIQSGDAINYNTRFESVLDDLELVAPSNKLASQKDFLFVMLDRLGKSYKKSDYTSKESVENAIKKNVNEHYKSLA